MKRSESNRPKNLPPPDGVIHRSIELLRTALEQLCAAVTLAESERLAILVNQAMTADARSFHTPEHVFNLVEPHNAHTTLAALFHDLVYYTVDRGFLPEIAETLEGAIELAEGGVRIRAEVGDLPTRLAMGVFGFAPGQKLDPYAGLNEFLSALVMNRRLGDAVRPEDLLLSTACIETTIPFRKRDAEGVAPAEHLARRMESTSRELGLAIPAERLRTGVRWAVGFANRDVSNFAEAEVSRFLDNTWKLLPETNPSLRTHGIYSIRSYRTALQGMEGFLRSLDPSTIFAQYDGEPADEAFRTLNERAQRNVTTGRSYLGIKLLAAAILEALAEVSGGDAPMSLFMGELDARRPGSRLDDYLPDDYGHAELVVDDTLHDLLAKGRASASRFDLQNSPLSLFIYLVLGTDGTRSQLEAAKRMFKGTLAPAAFLDGLPAALIAPIAEACAQMVFSRREPLTAYAASRRR